MFPLIVKYPEGKPWNFFLFFVALFVCLFVYYSFSPPSGTYIVQPDMTTRRHFHIAPYLIMNTIYVIHVIVLSSHETRKIV